MGRKQKLLSMPDELLLSEEALSILVKKRKHRKIVILNLVAALSIIFTIILVTFYWYSQALASVNQQSGETKIVNIKDGMSPTEIGALLKSESLIRSTAVFDIYTRLNGLRSKLQAGPYKISQKSSTPEIASQLSGGKIASFDIMLYPGATLASHRKQFELAGYGKQEIEDAFSNYDASLPLFESKPSNADLEGYIYGETYKFAIGTPMNEVLSQIFEHYQSNIVKYELKQGFAKQGLSLFEGITLASIVQRETLSPAGDEPTEDQRMVAQVFLNRLNSGMNLGSDVTYQYIADKLNIARDPTLDNPYNTRVYRGLPPGPISSPSLSALRSVTNPIDNNYLYFLSGDDDITYFATTNYEHEQNIKNHCQKKCLIY